MSGKWIVRLLKYGIAAAVGGAMCASVLSLHGYADAASDAERFRILADAFTIPGVILMLCWVLVWLSGEGAFEGISYAFSYAFRMLVPGGAKNPERYSDYVLRRREKGALKGVGFLFLTGAAFFAVALVFIALFYSVYAG